jgi:hypothetical protein
MKQAHIEVIDQLDNSGPLGLSLKLKIPIENSFSLFSIIKPLLDGIVSALHVHKNTNLSVVVQRLSDKLEISSNDLECLLKDKSQAALGSIDLVQPYRNFVKWNPTDDRLVYVDIKIEDSKDDNWYHSGTIFKPKKLMQSYDKIIE